MAETPDHDLATRRLMQAIGESLSKAVNAEARLRQLLERIRGWDMLDACADGPYWKAEIDAALAPPSDATPP